jgi:hypothetical protein
MSKVILILTVPAALFGFLLLGDLNYESSKQRAFPASYAVTQQLEEVQQKMKVERARFQKAEEAEGTPKAVVETTEHDFGVMEPDTDGSCEFVIRNEGTAPLTLVDGGKTCFCVGFNVSDLIVEPGESVVAELAWNTKFPSEEYRHGASLRTNDPDMPLLKFRVNGSVLTTLGFDQDVLMFSKIWPGQPQTQEMLLFSEVLDEFEIVEGVISNPRFEWSARKLTSDELPLRSQSAYAIKITAPGDLPRGRFEEELTLTVKRPDRKSEEDTEKLSLNIQGYTAKRLTIFGKELSGDGTLNFSVVTPAQGRTAKLFLRVNDELKDLSLEHVEVRPEFLEVDLQPENPEKGLYTLTISIPPYSPQGTYTADTSGSIRLEFDHPRIKDLELNFNAVILPVGQSGS